MKPKRMRWAVNRARMRLARFVWPHLNPLPPLFTAATDGVRIDSVDMWDGDTKLCDIDIGVELSRGDSWTINHMLEVLCSSGERVKVAAQMVPCVGAPTKLYGDDRPAVGELIAHSIDGALAPAVKKIIPANVVIAYEP